MQEKLQNFAQLPAHRVTDSCIVALLSHGVEGGVYGVDGKVLQVCSLLDGAGSHLPPSACAGCCCVYKTQKVLVTIYPPFFLVPFHQLQEVFRLFDNVNCPSLQNKPKMFFIQACRGGECLQDEHGVAAPGQPPPSSHFPVCSSQVLLDPLGTSFCSLLPPPLLLCKCPRCMGCAGTWAAHGSQVGQLSAPPCLFSGLFSEDSDFFLCLPVT